MDTITKEFIATVRCNAANDDVGDIMPELARLNLESNILGLAGNYGTLSAYLFS